MKKYLEKIPFIFLFLVILFSFFLVGNVTVFEDGSVQFFNVTGLGLCVFPEHGCSPELYLPTVKVYKDNTILITWCKAKHCSYQLDNKENLQ